MLQQRTLQSLTKAVGVGLHSGQRVELTLRPAQPDTGIVFRRVDLPEPVDIPVSATAVTGRFELCFGEGTTKAGLRTLPVEFALTRAANAVTGSLVVDGRRAAVQGDVAEAAALNRTNAFASGSDWPAWQGVDAGVGGLVYAALALTLNAAGVRYVLNRLIQARRSATA